VLFWSSICTIGYYLMIDVLLLRFNVNVIGLHLRNISRVCLQSASRSYANAYVNVFQCLHVYNGCLAWYNVLLIPLITQAWNTVNWWYMLRSHYILCLLSLRFFSTCIIRVLVSCWRYRALCSSWLYFTVELIRLVNTTLYYAKHPL